MRFLLFSRPSDSWFVICSRVNAYIVCDIYYTPRVYSILSLRVFCIAGTSTSSTAEMVFYARKVFAAMTVLLVGVTAVDITAEMNSGWIMGLRPRQETQNLQTFAGTLGGVSASAVCSDCRYDALDGANFARARLPTPRTRRGRLLSTAIPLFVRRA